MNDIRFIDIMNVDEQTKEKVREWRNNDYIRNNMLSQHIISYKEHADWLKKIQNDKRYLFWLVYLGKVPIGTAYLTNIDWNSKTSDWGYYIGESAYRNTGLGKRILAEFLDLIFYDVKMASIKTKVLGNNKIAIHIYRLLGFSELSVQTNDDKTPGSGIKIFYLSKNTWIHNRKIINE